jgi:hypothetical protein
MIIIISLVDQLMNYHTDNCLSLLKPKFDPKSVYMGSVVDRAALGQVSFQIPQFSPVSILSPMLRIHSSVADAIKILQLTLSLINAFKNTNLLMTVSAVTSGSKA